MFYVELQIIRVWKGGNIHRKVVFRLLQTGSNDGVNHVQVQAQASKEGERTRRLWYLKI